MFSDYGAVGMLHSTHRTSANAGQAGKQALEAGIDLEAPCDYGFGRSLLKLVKRGEVSIDLVDQAVVRIL